MSTAVIIFATSNVGNVLSASILILPQLVAWVRLGGDDKGQFKFPRKDKVTCQGWFATFLLGACAQKEGFGEL